MLLRRLILVAFLLAAQLVASAHALEHIGGKSDGHFPGQTCSVCLVAHDLTAALTASVPPLPPFQASFALVSVSSTGRDTLPALLPHQRGPPAA
ncbi:MAG: hypothetical protein RIR18_491 [Pseudomonadota bacterium]|jgi:hypothetical protein